MVSIIRSTQPLRNTKKKVQKINDILCVDVSVNNLKGHGGEK